MAKASPIIRSFNAGEFSPLMEGRTDLDRYPASLRTFKNFIAAPQGPALSRSGTSFIAPARADNQKSTLVPFVFSNEQATQLEFSDDRIRFISENGLLVYAAVSCPVSSAAGDPIVFTSAALAANVGDQVALSGWAAEYNLNGEIATITNVAGTTYTLDKSYPDLPVVNGQVSRVYHVPCAYTEQQRETLRHRQSVDVMYLFTEGVRPRQLSRFGTYDWRLEDITFVDGPYLPINETSTKLSPGNNANAIPAMTSNTLPSGTASGSGNRPNVVGTFPSPALFLGRQLTYELDASEFYFAFDNNEDTYWAGFVEQAGSIRYDPATAFVCDGYSIYVARDNQDTSYIATDYAPSTFTFEGWDGSAWTVLDRQEDYVLYDGGKSVFFELSNETAYQGYRLNIKKLVRNGLIEPRVQRLVMREKDETELNITASATTGVNNDQGFLSTDVGRLLRIKGSDGAWRSCEIISVTSTTLCRVRLLGEPLIDLKPISEWRLGYWSDTTGWPTTADFFEDRLWMGGSTEYPDVIAASVVGAYTTFQQTDQFGVVLDDSAIVERLNARKLSKIRWISSDVRGLLIGTGSETFGISSPNEQPLTARNRKARSASRRGSANVEPVTLENQIVYVHRSGRNIRELAFRFEENNYKSPSMSQLASHIGAVPFVHLEYAAEPHSIVWALKRDGTVAGLTYNRDENVVGWHTHDFAGAVVESIAVIPQSDQLQDALWLSLKRTVDGVDKRYIEVLTRFWDFDNSLEDAQFVDSALRYDGSPTTVIYGLQHLEGLEVYGLGDDKPIGPFTVTNGSITMPNEVSKAVIGIGYESLAIASRINAGAADGTSQGKVKRGYNVTVNLWDSFLGEVGVYNEQEDALVYEPLEYPGDLGEAEEVELYTGILGPFTVSKGYDKDGIIGFRRGPDSPLPFNVLALMPQINTQDR